MKLPAFKISERNQIVLFLLGIGLVIFLIWYYGIRDIRQQRLGNEAHRRELAASGFADQTLEALAATVDYEKSAKASLEKEWETTLERLATFLNQRALGHSNPLRIDYKVELLRTRSRLDKKAAALGVGLSASDLGMSDEVFTGDDPRKLMIQLRAAEKLVDLALDRQIRTLHKVEPKDPILHKRPSDGILILEEFPVEAEFDVDFANFYDLFRVVFEANRVFVFRNVRIVSGATSHAPLRVTAIMSALLFDTELFETE